MSIVGVLLSAGIGSRLAPLTNNWPKCLMPIRGRALLDYWLELLFQSNLMNKVLVNTHAHHKEVEYFLSQEKFVNFAICSYEKHLLGSVGTLRKNKSFIQGKTVLLAHADNFSYFDVNAFYQAHKNQRPKDCLMTMMTFDTDEPSECGIVTLDKQKRVVEFYEKKNDDYGTLASGAVFLLEPELVEIICDNHSIFDISNDLIPSLLGSIYTWHNSVTHIDIGTIKRLIKAQSEAFPINFLSPKTAWDIYFSRHSIHKDIGKFLI